MVATGVGISVLPALRGSRLDLAARMNRGDREGVVHGGTLRRLLIVSQFAASAVLLVSALLVTRSYLTIDHTENGYATDGIVTMRVSLDGDAYEDPRQRLGYLDQAVNRLRLTGHRRIRGRRVGTSGLEPAPRPAWPRLSPSRSKVRLANAGEARIATLDVVTSGYLETMEIPIVEGRRFTAAEIDEGSDVMLLSDRLTRRIWPDGVRVGRRVRLVGGEREQVRDVWLTVVGITRDVIRSQCSSSGSTRRPSDQLYLPYGDAAHPVDDAGTPYPFRRARRCRQPSNRAAGVGRDRTHPQRADHAAVAGPRVPECSVC